MIEGGWLSGWNFWAGVKAAATDEISSSTRETSALLLGPFNGLNQAPSYYIGWSSNLLMTLLDLQNTFTTKPRLVFDWITRSNNLVKLTHKGDHSSSWSSRYKRHTIKCTIWQVLADVYNCETISQDNEYICHPQITLESLPFCPSESLPFCPSSILKKYSQELLSATAE